VSALLPLAAGLDWGSVPDWLAAVGTLLAFAVALGLFRKEQTARREQEEDRRREQVGPVSAWTELEVQRDEAGQASGMDFQVYIRNGGPEPVHDLRVTLVAEGSAYASDPEAVRNEDDTLKETGPMTI
jgi:hypothetical protein